MEAIIVFALVTTFGVIAARYGRDSREGLRCKEQELASYGVTWSELSSQQEIALELEATRRSRQTRLLVEAA